MTTTAQIKRGVYGVWRQMSAHGWVAVADLDETERAWAALLVRHRLATVRAGGLTQLDRASSMTNWEALERGAARTALPESRTK